MRQKSKTPRTDAAWTSVGVTERNLYRLACDLELELSAVTEDRDAFIASARIRESNSGWRPIETAPKVRRQTTTERKMSDEKTPVAYLHQVVCGDGEPDQALSFEPDNFPLAGILGYRSLSHEPLFRAPLNNEMERLRTELGRAYRALHAFAFADREGKRLNETAVMYHSPTIGAAARFVHEGALDGSEYFIGKTVDVLHAALRGEQPLPANTGNEPRR